MNNVIEFRDVSLSYDGKEAVLLHASFSLEEGKMVLFSGPSGCGKSTIGKLISGIIPEVVKGEIKCPRCKKVNKIIYPAKGRVQRRTSE